MMRNLMVAYDGSKSADDAVEFAATFARAFATPVHVLMVARPLEYTVSVEFQSDEEQARLHCEQVLQRARAKLKDEVIPPFSAGIRSGKRSRGHRQLLHWRDAA